MDKTSHDPAGEPVPLAWNLQTIDVPANGLAVAKKASPDERIALAQALDLLSCDTLSAEWRVRRTAGDGFRVHGKLTADVVQACVITLAPVHDTVSAPFTVEFVPTAELDARGGGIDLEADTEFEPIEDGALAIGRIIFEELSAVLNPYPRRPGAEYMAPEPAKAPAETPFAALAKLKKGAPGSNI